MMEGCRTDDVRVVTEEDDAPVDDEGEPCRNAVSLGRTTPQDERIRTIHPDILEDAPPLRAIVELSCHLQIAIAGS